MGLIIECIIICVIMWAVCFLLTGNDYKNLNGLRSYPIEVQDIIKKNKKYKDKIKPINMIKVFENGKKQSLVLVGMHGYKVFISNLVMFSIILFIFGLFIKTENFIGNFINILILGEVLNLFDLVVIDLLWWRNTKRIRFSDIPEKEKYQDPKQHIGSFERGIIMYLIIAVIDGIILTII